MICIYRVKRYGAYFCSATKKHCGIHRVILCAIKDLGILFKPKEGKHEPIRNR
jgi:hypothetical protein